MLWALVCLAVFPAALPEARAALPAGWLTADVGSVGVAGNANEAGGVFTLNGAGSNIWGAADQFRFAYQQVSGNCSIVARVQTLQYVPGYYFAKAGVMIRENLATNSACVYVGANSSSTSLIVARYSNGADWTGGQWFPNGANAPYWYKIERIDGTIKVYAANNDGSSPPTAEQWGNPVLTMANNMGPNVLVGLVANSENNTALNQATFNGVATTGTTSAPYPPTQPGWTSLDIGSPGAAGSAILSSGVFTVKGAGEGIWDNTDSFQYAYWPLHGNGWKNGSLTVKLTGQDASPWNSLAGVMIRDNLTPNANSLLLAREPGGVLRVRRHQINDMYTGWGAETDEHLTLPRWLKIERSGNTFRCLHSADGTSWSELYAIADWKLPTEIYIGIAVTSSTPGTLHTATFANVSTAGTSPFVPGMGWLAQQLGSGGQAGNAYQDAVANVFRIKGSGTGFAGNVDNGYFAYKAVTGNQEVVARVGSAQGATNASAPAALMFRDSLNTASKNVIFAMSADNTLRFQYHTSATATTSTTISTSGIAIPSWLKLLRNGNVFTGYYSQDGFNWIQAGSATVSLATNAYAGLAVSSKNTSQTNTVLFDQVNVGPSSIPPSTFPVMTDILATPGAGISLIDEIDTAVTPPVFQSVGAFHQVQNILGRQARVMPIRDGAGNVRPEAATACTIGYMIGVNKGLVPGKAYILTVEYPDDVSRGIYIVNRGADYIRGFATGKATGDARAQFTECSIESLNYPQTGQWQVYKQYFHLLDRFQEIEGYRDPVPGYRPYEPAAGFPVAITRVKHLNDPRSEGAAVGKIRLYAVANPAALYAPINYPPANLPRRSIFWREEMADGLLATTGNPNDFAVSDSVNWYVHKMRMAKVLGINTLAKDLLEFGFNQGWETGDLNFAMEGQPPNHDLWTRLVPKATAEGFNLMPYFEYKGGIGIHNNGLGNARRAQKLYHGIKATCGNTAFYDCAWWTQAQNADLTDPDTLVDAKRMLDRTIGDFKAKGKFNGIWLRMRSNCLPMSFAASTLARFNAATGNSATQASMIASYEGNRTVYNQYVNWWYAQRRAFLIALRDYLRNTLGVPNAQVVFTPWTNEAVPSLHHLNAPYGHCGVITDDTAWWWTFHHSQPEGWWKYQWQPTAFSQVVSDDLYQMVLAEELPINHGMNGNNEEQFHGSPIADPQRYAGDSGVMMSFPIGRLFTLEDKPLLNSYRCSDALTVIRHYTLNEDNASPEEWVPKPFDGQLGYLSVSCDRAGHYLVLQQARAIAHGDPTNLGYLEAASLSCGFPEVMRKFNQAYLAVPALPSTVVTGTGSPSNSAVVMRRISTSGQGTYYYVVNTSMNQVSGVTMTLAGTGAVKELVTNQTLPSANLNLTLAPGELRSYRVGP